MCGKQMKQIDVKKQRCGFTDPYVFWPSGSESIPKCHGSATLSTKSNTGDNSICGHADSLNKVGKLRGVGVGGMKFELFPSGSVPVPIYCIL